MGTISKLQNAITAKEDIKAALTEKGRNPSDLLSSYGDEVRAICDKINNGQDIEVIADSQISIGDTIYTMNYSGQIYSDTGTSDLNNIVKISAFSPDGSLLILGGNFSGYAKVYSVSGTTITYVSDIFSDSGSTALSNYVNAATFSPDGTTLVLGGDFSGYAKIYSVSGTTITYISDIYDNAGTTALSSAVYTSAFSSNGSLLVLGGSFSGRAKVYSVSSTTVTYISDIYADTGTTALSSVVYTSAFSPDGSTLVLGGQFSRYAKVYSVSGKTVTFVSNIYADAGTTYLSNTVQTSAFSPDGSLLVLGGNFSGYAQVYSVSGTTITFVGYIYGNSETTYLSNYVYTSSFSSDGTTLVLGGNFSGQAKVYSVAGTTITYVSDVYADDGTTVLSNAVETIAFSPDCSIFVIGGHFSDFATFYTIKSDFGEIEDPTKIECAGKIYSNSEMTALNASVNTATLSPNGSLIVLGGGFSGYAKVYSVSGATITYVSDIYSDAESTALNGAVQTAAFSPDGTMLVLGGGFSGYAKLYSVSGETITYACDIYADGEMSSLSSTVRAAAFSPDGNSLVIGGESYVRAKVYSVAGTSVTYVSDIYADSGSTALSSVPYSVSFSPDGSLLVIGLGMNGGAKLYTVSGQTITYASNIYIESNSSLGTSSVYHIAFSPDGGTLVLSGNFEYYANIYSVSGTSVVYQSSFFDYDPMIIMPDLAMAASGICFSSDGKTFFMSEEREYTDGNIIGVYSVSGVSFTRVGRLLTADESNFSALSSVLVFCPINKILVACGAFTDRAYVYAEKRINTLYGMYAFVANNGVIKPESTGTGIGYSRTNIDARESGIVKLIGSIDLYNQYEEISSIKSALEEANTSLEEANAALEDANSALEKANESWSGTLAFSGSYSSSDFYTASGCSLAVDKQKKMAFVTIQGGTSSSYENILFNTSATLPTGVTMLAPQAGTHSSNYIQRYYTCVLTGITGKINVAVNFDMINSSNDYVRATLTVTYA